MTPVSIALEKHNLYIETSFSISLMFYDNPQEDSDPARENTKLNATDVFILFMCKRKWKVTVEDYMIFGNYPPSTAYAAFRRLCAIAEGSKKQWGRRSKSGRATEFTFHLDETEWKQLKEWMKRFPRYHQRIKEMEE